ncbi:MAG: Cys-tRNA(Pro) deacylase [Geodermatophilaceae bacterium]|nr:Cys-tRNA(Pro) deacylase [Geodermatophilaceae bacterium]
MTGRATPATALLDRGGVHYRLHSYSHDPRTAGYGAEAAAALGVDPGRVFKTLVVSVDGRLTVGIVPVATSLDLKALAGALGGKRGVLADAAEAARVTGYVVGGISPLGQRRVLPTVLDSAAADLTTVLVSGGRRGLEIELAPADLLRLTGGSIAAISAAR